jgi:hypothetical protein
LKIRKHIRFSVCEHYSFELDSVVAFYYAAPNPYRSVTLGLTLAGAGLIARLVAVGTFEVDKKERLEDLNRTLVIKDIAHLAPQPQARQ